MSGAAWLWLRYSNKVPNWALLFAGLGWVVSRLALREVPGMEAVAWVAGSAAVALALWALGAMSAPEAKVAIVLGLILGQAVLLVVVVAWVCLLGAMLVDRFRRGGGSSLGVPTWRMPGSATEALVVAQVGVREKANQSRQRNLSLGWMDGYVLGSIAVMIAAVA